VVCRQIDQAGSSRRTRDLLAEALYLTHLIESATDH
jgi:hypothetical protein